VWRPISRLGMINSPTRLIFQKIYLGFNQHCTQNRPMNEKICRKVLLSRILKPDIIVRYVVKFHIPSTLQTNEKHLPNGLGQKQTAQFNNQTHSHKYHPSLGLHVRLPQQSNNLHNSEPWQSASHTEETFWKILINFLQWLPVFILS